MGLIRSYVVQGQPMASYYLGSVKPDFLRRFGYAFDERQAGFAKVVGAVEAQSDICRLDPGPHGQRLL
eukprot:scaffold509840_cov38-Prasinocladus_malaysianus.AAC.1